MIPDDQTPAPRLAHAFEMVVERGPVAEIGALAAGGRRTQVPVTGGTVTGDSLRGVLIGGSETVLQRPDGVATVEASYVIRAGDGSCARAFGRGYRTVDGSFAGLRLSLLFEADEDGPLAHLARRAFLAEGLPDEARLTVMRID